MSTDCPSSSGALPTSVVRRRSNTNSPVLNRLPVPQSSPPDRLGFSLSCTGIRSPLTVQVEDTDAGEGRPTVLLVHRLHGLGILPVEGIPERSVSMVLPFAGQQVYGSARPTTIYRQVGPVPAGWVDAGYHPMEDVSPMAMSLSPDPSSCIPSPTTSVETTSVSESWAPLSPVAADVLSSRNMGCSLLPQFTRSPDDDCLSASVEPQIGSSSSGLPLYSATKISTSSQSSPASALSSPATPHAHTQPTHRPLLPSLSTADKLTHKFPMHHRSMRNISLAAMGRRSKGRSGAAFAGTLLGEWEGLGIEWPDRWTKHKWCLMLSVCTVFVYGLGGLVFAVLTWYKTWMYADVMAVADFDLLILITVSSAILLLTFLIGITGTILNSRPILALYAILLWPTFGSILAIGYTSYKRSTFALDRKLNFAWSQWYTTLDRLIIQDVLHCCGFYNAMHEVTPSKTCYVRTSLPGCKAKLLAFERMNLGWIWMMAFSVVPLHVMNIFVALCCVNHVTVTFGKGIMPKRYRLKGEDVRRDAERIFGAVGTVARPGIVRASSSSVFREDKNESVHLLNDSLASYMEVPVSYEIDKT